MRLALSPVGTERGVKSTKQGATWFDCWAEFLYCCLSGAFQLVELMRNVGWTVPTLPESCLGLRLMLRQYNKRPSSSQLWLTAGDLDRPGMRWGSAAARRDLGSPEMPPSSLGWSQHRQGATNAFSWYQPLTQHGLRGRLPPWLPWLSAAKTADQQACRACCVSSHR